MPPKRDSSRLFVVDSSRHSSLPAEQVMQRVVHPGTWPDWQPEIISTEGPQKLAVGDVVTGGAELLGFKVRGTSTAIEVEPEHFVEEVVVGVRMRILYRVQEQADGGCLVTRRLEATLPGGFSGRVLALFLRWRLKRMQDRVLDSLVESVRT